MPLIDAALAFALTMLAVASLSTTLVAFINSKMRLRKEELEKMVREFFQEKALPAAEKELESLIRQGSNKVLTRMREEVEEFRVAQEKILDGKAQHDKKQAKAAEIRAESQGFLKEAQLRKLLDDINAEDLVSLSTDGLKSWLRHSELGQEWTKHLGDEADQVLDALGREWEKLGEKYTAFYRNHAKKLNTLVAALLALFFNIDAVFVLDVYLNDDDARTAVISQQDEITGGSQAITADSDVSYGVVQQELIAFQESGFPVGWEHFPNCPPTSADDRCVKYWQGALDDFDISKLSFKARQEINPAAHPLVALLGKSAPGELTEAQETWGGKLKPLPLLAWLVGLCLTAFLAGQGAPFWFEAVQQLTNLRQEWRKDRGGDKTRSAEQVLTDSAAPTPGSPTPNAPTPDSPTPSSPTQEPGG